MGIQNQVAPSFVKSVICVSSCSCLASCAVEEALKVLTSLLTTDMEPEVTGWSFQEGSLDTELLYDLVGFPPGPTFSLFF